MPCSSRVWVRYTRVCVSAAEMRQELISMFRIPFLLLPPPRQLSICRLPLGFTYWVSQSRLKQTPRPLPPCPLPPRPPPPADTLISSHLRRHSIIINRRIFSHYIFIQSSSPRTLIRGLSISWVRLSTLIRCLLCRALLAILGPYFYPTPLSSSRPGLPCQGETPSVLFQVIILFGSITRCRKIE